jgi:hypothetical protein
MLKSHTTSHVYTRIPYICRLQVLTPDFRASIVRTWAQRMDKAITMTELDEIDYVDDDEWKDACTNAYGVCLCVSYVYGLYVCV